LDEYQEMNSNLFAFFDMFLRIIRNTRHEPFGGLSNIFAGDCLQHISMKHSEHQKQSIKKRTGNYYNDVGFAICLTNQSMLDTFDIFPIDAKNHRTDDIGYKELLLRMRRGFEHLTSDDINFLNTLVVKSNDPLRQIAIVTDSVAYFQQECSAIKSLNQLTPTAGVVIEWKARKGYVLMDRLREAIKMLDDSIAKLPPGMALCNRQDRDRVLEALLCGVERFPDTANMIHLCTERCQMNAYNTITELYRSKFPSNDEEIEVKALYLFGYRSNSTKQFTSLLNSSQFPNGPLQRENLPDFLKALIPKEADVKQKASIRLKTQELYTVTTNAYQSLSNGQTGRLLSINSGSSRGGDDSILFQPFDPVGKIIPL
jgi:hypothetical protein